MRGISEERLRELFEEYQHRFLSSQLEKMYEPHAVMNMLQALLDECAELNQQWMPIESAPMDRWILVINENNNYRPFVARYKDGKWRDGECAMDFVAGVTHWMELPPNPEPL